MSYVQTCGIVLRRQLRMNVRNPVVMKKKGITYKVAKDGQQAVDMWKKGNFHLVLVSLVA